MIRSAVPSDVLWVDGWLEQMDGDFCKISIEGRDGWGRLFELVARDLTELTVSNPDRTCVLGKDCWIVEDENGVEIYLSEGDGFALHARAATCEFRWRSEGLSARVKRRWMSIRSRRGVGEFMLSGRWRPTVPGSRLLA